MEGRRRLWRRFKIFQNLLDWSFLLDTIVYIDYSSRFICDYLHILRDLSLFDYWRYSSEENVDLGFKSKIFLNFQIG